MRPTQTPRPLTGCLTDADRLLSFDFEGQTITAVAGQSIAAALYAAGVRIFTRSFKYHRPRGLFCVSGDCPNCLMQVDGRPNVRTCIEPVRLGQVVRHQNAWPGLRFDLLRVLDKLDRFLPVGFYYKRFHRPRWLWPIFEHAVRHIAGLGRIDTQHVPHLHAVVEHLHTEVCVVGGGPAGMAAAEAAAKAGADVLLLDRQQRLGGHLLFDRGEQPVYDLQRIGLPDNPRLRVLNDTAVFGLYEGNLLGAFRGDCLLKIRAKRIIVCTGGRQRPFLFQNNDLPGIFLSQGILRLAHLYGVCAGSRAVVLTDNDAGVNLVPRLSAVGIEVAAVVDVRLVRSHNDPRPVHGPLLRGHVILAARGNRHLKAVCVAQVKEDGGVDETTRREIACDLLCLASPLQPANELLLQGGMRFRYADGRWQPERKVAGVAAAGAAADTVAIQAQRQEGWLRGVEAAAALGYPQPAGGAYPSSEDTSLSASAAPIFSCLCPARGAQDRKRFVCLCEDVTEKDVHQAIAEGFDGIETLKRYTTAHMGPCQGKVCGQTALELCARITGRDMNTVGVPTSRPPAIPVELALLAAGQHQAVVRRTPLHHWHEQMGARWLDAGQWKRPESYGDPAVEVRNVRTAVGLIDVSTLGKMEVVGPDAAELLERVYINKWADLKTEQVRYGIMCNEDGILLDDGVGVRLDPQRFYLTATTGNAEGIFQWLELWRATWRLNVTVLNQTSAWAALNLAGPRARDLLSRLTGIDISAAAFPYLAVRTGKIAGVPCRVLRIGFVGELGYEIHCPSAYAWHLWEALCQAGREFGLRPFGVEAQRILRLEKGHLILGQDTDTLSNPLEAGFKRLVRFDKPLFHGREPLLRRQALGPRSRLVGFQMVDTLRVPPEGCQVVDQGRPVGRLTSTRFSPTLGRSIGLAWLPAAHAAAGERFLIRWNEVDLPAVVTPVPFYDPQGKRLRS
jgi:sarcosine oxidase subunit alpha